MLKKKIGQKYIDNDLIENMLKKKQRLIWEWTKF